MGRVNKLMCKNVSNKMENIVTIINQGGKKESIDPKQISGLLISFAGTGNIVILHEPFTFANSVFRLNTNAFVEIMMGGG